MATQFRPCIDLHAGQVKQIVGGSLTDEGAQTNFISDYDASYYAKLYKKHNLTGGHLIALGASAANQQAALAALNTWQGGLQYGGGVNLENAHSYLDAGASHVIVTSFLFEQNQFSWERLKALQKKVSKSRLVLDLSCRKTANGWCIATNGWQTLSNLQINAQTLSQLQQECAEFLIHAADVEGLQAGIDEQLVQFLGAHVDIPTTYAGGARNLEDLQRVKVLSNNKLDLTIGSALDIFGGDGVTLEQCLAFNQGAFA